MPKLLLTANTDWYLYNFRYAWIHALRDAGHEVVLLSPPGAFAERLRAAGFRWLPWRLQRRSLTPWRELLSLFDLTRIYRREQPDLVHHHTIKAVLYGSLAARWTGIPAVVNSIAGRGYVFQGADCRARALRFAITPLYRRALRGSSAVIFETAADRLFFLAAGFVEPSRAHLVEGVGVDPMCFSPTPEPPAPPVTVVMAARFLWEKGVGVFVEAARLLRERLDVRMVLVGEPDPGNPTSLSSDRLARWHLEGAIEWWGWQENMEAVYQRAHIVVLPTRYGEGVPTTLVEAAACARPLVATDIPGCRAVVLHEENGLLVPPDDPRALAAAIEQLARHPAARRRMGARGREIVLERFSHERINDATLEVYRAVLETDR